MPNTNMPINGTKRLHGAKWNFNLETNSSITWIELLKLYLFKLHRGFKKIHFSKQFLVIQEAESTIRWTR